MMVPDMIASGIGSGFVSEIPNLKRNIASTAAIDVIPRMTMNSMAQAAQEPSITRAAAITTGLGGIVAIRYLWDLIN